MATDSSLIVLTGPSGFVNKTVLLNKIVAVHPDFIKIVSYTDRPIREGERNGIDFHFISEDEFTAMVEQELFLEWQRVLANNVRYGKTKEDINNALKNNSGKITFTIVNIINLPVFKRYYPNSTSIFIDVKDNLKLIEYLKNSPEVNDDEEFERRYKYATEERRRRHLADFIINMQDENNKDQVIEEMLKIVETVSQKS